MDSVNFILVYLIFGNIMFLVHMELPHRGNSNVYLQHVFSKNEFYKISFFFFLNSQLLSLFQ